MLKSHDCLTSKYFLLQNLNLQKGQNILHSYTFSLYNTWTFILTYTNQNFETNVKQAWSVNGCINALSKRQEQLKHFHPLLFQKERMCRCYSVCRIPWPNLCMENNLEVTQGPFLLYGYTFQPSILINFSKKLKKLYIKKQVSKTVLKSCFLELFSKILLKESLTAFNPSFKMTWSHDNHF